MRVMRPDGTLEWSVVRLASLFLVNLVLALPVAGWSWVWATYPVNDGVAPRMTDADWTRHATWEARKTLVRAVILFVILVILNRRLLEASGPRARRVAYVVAALAALVVLGAGWLGAYEFWRDRPVF